MPTITVVKASETLQRARDLIADTSRWCRGWDAKDKFGKCTDANDMSAYYFCGRGALRRACSISAIPFLTGSVYALLCDAADKVLEAHNTSKAYKEECPVTVVNDSLLQEAVLEMFAIAIAKAKELEAVQEGVCES